MKTTFSKSRLITSCLAGLTPLLIQVANAQLPPQTGLTMQLDAGTLAGSLGSAVSTWNEVGGGTSFGVVEAGVVAPTLASENTGNGNHNVVSFSGGNMLTSITKADGSPADSGQNVPFTDFVSANDGAIFLVLRSQGRSGTSLIGQTPFGWGGGAARFFAQTEFQGINGIAFQFGNGTPGQGSFVAAGTSINDNQWHILSMWRNGNSANIAIDGGAPVTGTFSGGLTGAANNEADIGGAIHGQDDWRGAIAEVLTYNTALDQTAVDQVEAYLLNKYVIVPEPTHYAMIFGAGCIALALWRRRSQTA